MNMGKSGAITGMVMAFVFGIIGFVFFDIYVENTDKLYRELTPTCVIGSETVSQVTGTTESSATPATGITVGSRYRLSGSSAGGACNVASFTTDPAGGVLVSESGTIITLGSFVTGATPISGGEWRPVRAVILQFGGISEMLTTLLPLALVVMFLSVGFLQGYQSGMTFNLAAGVGKEVMTLVLVVIAVVLSPIFFSFITPAYEITDGRFLVTEQFGDVTQLILSSCVIIYILGILTLITRSGWKAYSVVRTNRGVDNSMG